MVRWLKIHFFLLCILLVTLSSFAAPHKGLIRGSVHHAQTGQPLQGVNIVVANTTFGTTTNQGGEFILALYAGSWTVRASMMGFAAFEQTVRTAADSTVQLSLTLAPAVLHINKEVVVTARRNETNVFDLPNSMAVVSNDELNRKMPRSTAEALLETSGVWMQKTNHGGGSPFIRGLVGNQVLVLVDGIRLNNTTFRYGPNQYLNTIDPWHIERVEVQRGAGAVLHGSDALGGVINIITKQPRFSHDGVRVNGELLSRIMSSDMEKSGKAEFDIASTNVAVVGGFSLKDFGDLKAGGDIGHERPTGYSELDGDVKAMFRLSDRHQLTMAYQNVHQEQIPSYDQVAQRGYQEYSFDPQIRRLAFVRYQLNSASRWLQTLTLTSSWQQSVEQRKKLKQGASTRITEEDDITVAGISLESYDRPFAHWTITAGMDYYADQVKSWRKDLDLTTNRITAKRGLYPDGAEAQSLALYWDNAIPYGKMLLSLGGRYNQYTVKASDQTFHNLEINPSAWIGSASLMYSLHPHHKVYGSVSQGFRAPNINDMSTLGAFDYGIEVPSTALAPERTVNYELGYKARMNAMSGALAVYRCNLSDLIDRVAGSYNGSDYYENQRVYIKQNVDEAFIWGFESELEYQISLHLAAFGSVIYTYGQKTSTDEPMRRIPPLNGQIGLRFSSEQPLWGEARLLLATKQDRLAAGDRDDHRIPKGGTPGWTVFNLTGGYTLFTRLDVMLGMLNLFNEAYRFHGSGVDGYGRSLWLGVKYRI